MSNSDRPNLLILLVVSLVLISCTTTKDDSPLGTTPNPGNINVTVTSATTTLPVDSAFVVLSNPHEGYTDDNGEISFTNVSQGQHTIAITKADYVNFSGTVQIYSDSTVEFLAELTPVAIGSGDLVITVVNALTGLEIDSALVTVSPQFEGYTDDYGIIAFNDLDEGLHTIAVTKEGYSDYESTVNIYADSTLQF